MILTVAFTAVALAAGGGEFDRASSTASRLDHAAWKAELADGGLPPGLSATDWAGISSQIETQQLPGSTETDSHPVLIPLLGIGGSQQAYLKASNTGADDSFGWSVAMSGDTVVVGARYEDSNSAGVNGDQGDNSVENAGAVYVFVRSGGVWSQQAYLKASNPGTYDMFGWSLAISGDTLAVGSYSESSSATGVNGDQDDNSALNSGAAYVFVRSGGVWTQQAYLKASNTGVNDHFGYSVAISGDTAVVGASYEDSNATGVNGDGSNNSAVESGAAYVFTRSGGTWTQQAYLKASNTGGDGHFGCSVAISGDTVVVGAYGERSNATGVNGDQGNNSAPAAGAAYVFTRSGGTWTQQSYLKASNTGEYDAFGGSVAISGDTAVVGAPGEDSGATGVNGDQGDNSSSEDSGAAYIFVRSEGSWTQQAYLKASNPGWREEFGSSVAVSGDAAVVGAYMEDSNAVGVNGEQGNNDSPDSGAAYVFTRFAANWFQSAYLKASNTGTFDHFGCSVTISGDTVVAGANQEDSISSGVNGDASNDSSSDAGAAYVFTGQNELPDMPTITGIDPASGSVFGGNRVTITGTEFFGVNGASAVTFGGHDALSYGVDSDTQITAFAPPHDLGPVQVQVTAAVGATADTAADNYTYVAAVIPAHERVSVDSYETQGNSHSGYLSISGDGRYVAFDSMAYNLVPTDTNALTDVFVRDRLAGMTERVSVAADGTQANGPSAVPSVSADGRYVAFLSAATNLVPGDTNDCADVFTYDRQEGSIERVSVNSSGAQANSDSSRVCLSGDGRYVAFSSLASNLVFGDTNGIWDIFVYDRQSHITERVSVSSTEVQGNDWSDYVSISADGRYVAFDSAATNLVTGDTNGLWDVIVRDRTAGTTQRVNVSGSGSQGNDESGFPSISGDGRYVAFESYATNLVSGDTNDAMDVFVRDRTAGTTQRTSLSSAGSQGDDGSVGAFISADGRYVAFNSAAANLVPGDTNYDPLNNIAGLDAFVRDRVAGTTRRVNLSALGAEATSDSTDACISGDGRYAAFATPSNNLVPNDTNGSNDVFAVLIGSRTPYSSYRGSHRYHTAQLLSQAAFPAALPAGSGVVVAPGETFPEALCGAPLAAAFGGPVLLTPTVGLENGTKAELQRLLPDQVFVIGLSATVEAAVRTTLPAATVIAINGSDIYDMSYQVAKALALKVGDMSGATAIVTIGTNFPDAIGVSPLACAKLWPILLTNSGGNTSMHAKAVAALTELGITAFIKAGTYAPDPPGVSGLANLSGADRYDTCARVAAWAKANAGLAFTHTGLATGDKFPDALASGPYLAKDLGILLLSPLNGPLPSYTSAVLTANREAVEHFTYVAMIEPVISQVKALLP